MEKEELFKIITSEQKWYAAIPTKPGAFMTAQHASQVKRRFERDKLSEKFLEKLFNHFGYFKTPYEWQKK